MQVSDHAPEIYTSVVVALYYRHKPTIFIASCDSWIIDGLIKTSSNLYFDMSFEKTIWQKRIELGNKPWESGNVHIRKVFSLRWVCILHRCFGGTLKIEFLSWKRWKWTKTLPQTHVRLAFCTSKSWIWCSPPSLLVSSKWRNAETVET